jgi:hypothetical protein
MSYPLDTNFYIKRKSELLKKFDEDVRLCKPVIIKSYWQEFAGAILWEARKEFDALIPQIPYIGGDENNLTKSLVESARYLAFYKAMKRHGKTAEEAGKILWDATLTQVNKPRPQIPPAEILTNEEFFKTRRRGAQISQERRYPGDYVYEFIPGDGKKYDYGYDYTECAALKFYHTQGADEFMPFYCYLDFPICRVMGTGLTRTMTMSEGSNKCNHRIKRDGATKLVWPPPFLKRGASK